MSKISFKARKIRWLFSFLVISFIICNPFRFIADSHSVSLAAFADTGNSTILGVTLSPGSHVAGVGQDIRVMVTTSGVADGMRLTSALVDNKGSYAVADSMIKDNRAELILTVDSAVPPGHYDVLVNVTGVGRVSETRYIIEHNSDAAILGVALSPGSHVAGVGQDIRVMVTTSGVADGMRLTSALVDNKGSYAVADSKIKDNRAELILTVDSAVPPGHYDVLVNVTGVDRVSETRYIIGHNPDSAIKVMLNGIPLSFDVSPIVESGRVLVPFRAIGEALGAKVDWDAQAQTVRLSLRDSTVKLTIGDRRALINGQEVMLDVPPLIRDGRTLVPLRFVGEALGAEVEWIAETRQVVIRQAQHILE